MNPRPRGDKGGRVASSRSDPAARYRCHACGALFKAWAPAQRHADEARHHRVELIPR